MIAIITKLLNSSNYNRVNSKEELHHYEGMRMALLQNCGLIYNKFSTAKKLKAYYFLGIL
jgi:hypothetical protein